MTISPPAFLFIILASFVIGIACGISFWKIALVYGVRYAPCSLIHRMIVFILKEHFIHNPECDVNSLSASIVGINVPSISLPFIEPLHGSPKLLIPSTDAPECLRQAFWAGVTSDYIDASTAQDHWENACYEYNLTMGGKMRQ